MVRKLIRELGFMLISYGTLFMPVVASAEDGSTAVGVAVGFPAGAVITGVVLVSMSRTKVKATKADEYEKGDLTLHDRTDVYVRTDTTKVRVNKD